MEASLFEELRSSLTEAVAIAKGERAPSRTFSVTGRNVQQIRESAGLTQKELASLMRVSIKTLQNWEQGRRQPTGPAGALIRIFEKSPSLAIQALQA